MTLPWYLNPWAEVRKLEETCDGFNRLWCDALADCQELRDENDALRRRIAEKERETPAAPPPGSVPPEMRRVL